MPWALRNLATVVAMERVPRNPLVVHQIMSQVAECLAHVHKAGLVHGAAQLTLTFLFAFSI